MSYAVKTVSLSDFDALVDLWSLAFGAGFPHPSESERTRTRIETYVKEHLSILVGAYAGDRLVATTAVLDYPMHFAGKFVQCGGIAAVATSPEHRRRGLVKMMLSECLRRMHDLRVPIASLWPFSYPFYRRFGWAVSDFRYVVETDLGRQAVGGDAGAYARVSPHDFAGAAQRYERWIRRFNLGLSRGAHRWKHHLTDPHSTPQLFVHADGYMLLNTRPEGEVLQVKEWAWLTEEGFRDGLALLSQFDSQHRRARWQTHDVEPLLRRGISDPPPAISLHPGMMSRVVHVDAFMECLPEDTPLPEIDDPLGVSSTGSAGAGVSPGAIVQAVTGLWTSAPPEIPEKLWGAAGQLPLFTLERF